MRILILVPGVLALVLSTGCTKHVDVKFFENAMAACSKNDGVKSIVVDSKNVEVNVLEEVNCNDGATFRYDVFNEEDKAQ